MPMFFFVSGFFYRKDGRRTFEYIKKKAKSLLVPYLFWELVHYFVFLNLNGFSIGPLLRLMAINTDGLPIAGALWFLTALFFSNIIYFLLDRKKIKWMIFPLIIIGSFSDQILPYPLPWALSPAFVGLGLCWIGEMNRKYENRLEKFLNMNWWQILITGILVTGLIFTNGYVNMRIGVYSIIPLFWLNALLAIYLGIS